MLLEAFAFNILVFLEIFDSAKITKEKGMGSLKLVEIWPLD